MASRYTRPNGSSVDGCDEAVGTAETKRELVVVAPATEEHVLDPLLRDHLVRMLALPLARKPAPDHARCALLISDEAALAIVRAGLSLDDAGGRYGVGKRMVSFRLNVTGARIRVARARQARAKRLR